MKRSPSTLPHPSVTSEITNFSSIFLEIFYAYANIYTLKILFLDKTTEYTLSRKGELAYFLVEAKIGSEKEKFNR